RAHRLAGELEFRRALQACQQALAQAGDGKPGAGHLVVHQCDAVVEGAQQFGLAVVGLDHRLLAPRLFLGVAGRVLGIGLFGLERGAFLGGQRAVHVAHAGAGAGVELGAGVVGGLGRQRVAADLPAVLFPAVELLALRRGVRDGGHAHGRQAQPCDATSVHGVPPSLPHCARYASSAARCASSSVLSPANASRSASVATGTTARPCPAATDCAAERRDTAGSTASCRSSATAIATARPPAAAIVASASRTAVPAVITSSTTSTRRPSSGAPTRVPPSPCALASLRL